MSDQLDLELIERKKKLAELELVRKELRKRHGVGDPSTYGWPDLMREQYDGETDEFFEEWRRKSLKHFIENEIYFVKDGQKIEIKLIKPMENLIYDCFFGKTKNAILWKPRGSGGSVAVSIIIFLCMIYRKMSFVLFAGCLFPKTPIWTDRGWKSIEEVEIGDLVWTRKGFQPVTDVMEKQWPNLPVTKIDVFGYGKGITATSDHRFWVKRGAYTKNSKNNLVFTSGEGEWVEAGELSKEDAILIPVPEQSSNKPDKIPYFKTKNKHSPVEYYDWTPELGRFIGYWLAEGDVYINKSNNAIIRLNVSKDDEWLDDLEEIVNKLLEREVSWVEPDPNTREKAAYFGNTKLGEWLKENLGHSSYTKRIPLQLLEKLDNDILLNILIGWLRGDGWVNVTNRGALEVGGSTVSDALASAMYYISIRLGIPVYLYRIPSRKGSGIIKDREINSAPAWRLRWSGDFADYLVEKAFSWKVQKDKVNRAKRLNIDNKYVYVGIRDLNTYNYEGPVYDLSVKEDPCFVTPVGLAHNSQKQSQIVYHYVTQLWSCNTPMAKAMLTKDPTSTKIQMTRESGGVSLTCLPATQKAARGEHTMGLVIDECCLLPGSWIMTKEGMKKIEDIRVGDYVWTHKGRFRKVLGTRELYKENFPCVEIKPLGGLPTKTTGDHRWMGSNGEWKRRWYWNIKDRTFYAKASKSEPILYDRPEWLKTSEGWRFLGLHLGDGHTSKNNKYRINFTLGKRDNHGNLYKTLVKSLFNKNVKEYDYPYHEGTLDYSFSPGKNTVTEIKNISGQTAKTKGISSDLILSANEIELLQLLLGLIETDGNISITKSSTGGTCDRIFFHTISDKLAQNFALICNKLDLVCGITRNKARKSYIKGRAIEAEESWSFSLSGDSFRKIIPYLDPSYVDKRKRKFSDRIKQDEKGFYSPILKKRDFIYSGKVYDIEVEEDVCFSTPYSVFHNSQAQEQTDLALEAAMQGPLSEKDHLIIACSTFHNATGFYQGLWDYAKDKGFKRYKWNIYETMGPCRIPISCKKCFLTDKIPVYDKQGNVIKTRYIGCKGTARYTNGWQTYEKVKQAKLQNLGTTVFRVEFECERPETGRTVYPTLKLIEAQKACPKDINQLPHVPFDKDDCDYSIGIDWGIVQTAVVLAVKTREYIGILEARAFEGRPLNDITRYLQILHRKYKPGSLNIGNKEYGKQGRVETRAVEIISLNDRAIESEPITIYGDASHPFNTMELTQLGYVVEPVHFNQFKELGIENVNKYLHMGRLLLPKVRPEGDFEILNKQMQLYMRDNKNKPVKKNDHMPDALMLACLAFPYVEYYGESDLAAGSLPQDRSSTDVFVL